MFRRLEPGALERLLQKRYPRGKGWDWRNMGMKGYWIITKTSTAAGGTAFPGGMSPSDDYIMAMDYGEMIASQSGFSMSSPFNDATAMVMDYHPLKTWEVWWVKARHLGSDPFDPKHLTNMWGP
jgi:hypothetical protein